MVFLRHMTTCLRRNSSGGDNKVRAGRDNGLRCISCDLARQPEAQDGKLKRSAGCEVSLKRDAVAKFVGTSST